MKRKARTYGVAFVISLILLTSPVPHPAVLRAGLPSSRADALTAQYPAASWAVGVVAPEGAKLADGETLHWEDVSNVTIFAVLPNISLPDGIVYAVASVMTQGGTVLQAAAGVYPNSSSWLSYSWCVPDINLVPVTYRWILNGSGPEMAPGSPVTISMFRESGVWNLRIEDVTSGSSVERAFPVAAGDQLKGGDQEVFALESYSRTPSTFQDMGNFTLLGLYVDQEAVTGGLYSYSDWNTLHNPVFVVGSYRASAPGFISIEGESDGSVVWSYDAAWQNRGASISNVEIAMVVRAVASLSAAAVGVWTLGRRRVQGSSRDMRFPSSGDCSTEAVEYSLSVTPFESDVHEHRVRAVRDSPLSGPPGLHSGDNL